LDERDEQIIEEAKDATQEPLEVKVVNQKEEKKDDYDSKDDLEYDELGITEEQVKEFENGDSSS